MAKFFATALLLLAFSPSSYAEEDIEALCKHAYSKLDLGRALSRAGTPKERCMDEVELQLGKLGQDSSFFATVSERKFDRKVYLYMIVGGSAFAQCIEPKEVSYETFKDTTCKNIPLALPLPK